MDFSDKLTGFFKAKIIAVCPDKEELERLTGDVVEEEPEYHYEKKDGTKVCVPEFYFRDSRDNIFKYSIYLENNIKESVAGSILYVNQFGMSQWSNSEDNLWDSFKYLEDIKSWKSPDGEISARWVTGAKPFEKERIATLSVHESVVGEADLLHLLKVTKNLNTKDDQNSVFLNMEKIFEGNFKELRSELITDSDFDIVAFAYLNEKYEQKIFKRFLPVSMFRDIQNNMTMSKYSIKPYNEWLKDLEFNEGIHYKLGKLQEFKEEFLIKLKETKEDDSDY